MRLREDLSYGHVVRAFNVSFCAGTRCAYAGNGTSVGAGKIVPLVGALGLEVTSVAVVTDAQPAVSLTLELFGCSKL